MKLLLINHYAGSVYHGMEFRPYYMAREWVRAGHEVVVVAATFSHLRQKNVESEERVKTETIDGIRYIWLKTPSYSGNGAGRIMNMLAFVCKLYRYSGYITKDFAPDAVIASSTYPLDVYPARKIAKKYGAKFVFELHDLWPMSPMVLGNMSPYHPFIWTMQRGEDYWCRHADLVVSFWTHAYRHLVSRGMSMKQYTVIPNGISPEEWGEQADDMPEEHEKTISALKSKEKIVALYIGAHGIANGLDFILSAAELAGSSQIPLHFVLVGKGQEKERLVDKAKNMGLDNVMFLPPVPKKSVPKLLGSADVLVCCTPRTKLNEYGPLLNKTFDYMMSARPIVWAYSTPYDILEKAGCGYRTEPDDLSGFVGALGRVCDMNEEERHKMGKKGREYVLENFTYPHLAQKFIETLQNLKG